MAFSQVFTGFSAQVYEVLYEHSKWDSKILPDYQVSVDDDGGDGAWYFRLQAFPCRLKIVMFLSYTDSSTGLLGQPQSKPFDA